MSNRDLITTDTGGARTVVRLRGEVGPSPTSHAVPAPTTGPRTVVGRSEILPAAAGRTRVTS